MQRRERRIKSIAKTQRQRFKLARKKMKEEKKLKAKEEERRKIINNNAFHRFAVAICEYICILTDKS